MIELFIFQLPRLSGVSPNGLISIEHRDRNNNQ